MKGFGVLALVIALCIMQGTLAGEIPKPNFAEVRACLKDLTRINNENKNAGETEKDAEEAAVLKAMYENLYRAMACLEVLQGLENQEISTSLENEIHEWQAAIEAEE